MREKYVYFQSNAAATAAIGELTFTAVDKSAKGNLVSVAIPESGTESQVTVTVSGNAITCAIGTSDDMGGDNIVTAIEASADASALVGVVSSGATHITSAVSQTFLSGGEAGVSFPLSSFAGMHPTDDDTLRMFFKSMKNFDGMTLASSDEVVCDFVDLDLKGSDSDGVDVRTAMESICKAFTSARAREFDIVIADDRSDSVESIDKVIVLGVEGITIDAAS